MIDAAIIKVLDSTRKSPCAQTPPSEHLLIDIVLVPKFCGGYLG